MLAFYLVFAGIGLAMAAVLYEPAFQIVAVWFERKRSRALLLLTFIGAFASVVYIPLAGWLVEAYDWRTALLILAALQAVALLLLISNTSTAAVIIYVVLFGAGAGALTPARAAIVAEYYGRRHYGSMSGAVATAISGARAAAPITTGLLYTVTDSYLPVLWTLVASAALASVAVIKA